MITKIGVSASKAGITDKQIALIGVVSKTIVTNFRTGSNSVELHHGDCIGGDMEINSYFLGRYGDTVQRIGHPAKDIDPKYRAHAPVHKSWAAKPPLERNRDIVDLSSFMITCPREMSEVLRSGTWATTRYAIKQLTPMIIIYPNGEFKLMSITRIWFTLLWGCEL